MKIYIQISGRFLLQLLIVIHCLAGNDRSCFASTSTPASPSAGQYGQLLYRFASYGDRSTGTDGCRAAAAYIKERFRVLGVEKFDTFSYTVPVLKHRRSNLIFTATGKRVHLHPMHLNAISPGTIDDKNQLSGPLYYVGSGRLADLNGKPVKGAILLMDMHSGRNWQQAAALGAKALIYLDPGTFKAPTENTFYREKFELSPVAFPRFYLSCDDAKKYFDNYENAENGLVAPHVQLSSDAKWEAQTAENIYGLIPGADPSLQNELLIVEAFYDSRVIVSGKSPGADETLGIASLISLAADLKNNPPERSMLLVATAGHAQTLTGMREMIWNMVTKPKHYKKLKKSLVALVKKARSNLDCCLGVDPDQASDISAGQNLKTAVNDRLKTEVDEISRKLMRLRLQEKSSERTEIIRRLSQKRLTLRRLGWRSALTGLSPEESKTIREVIPGAADEHQEILEDTQKSIGRLAESLRFKKLIAPYRVAAVVSLHLSSHGDGIGAFNRGFLYNLKTDVNRISAYSTINSVLDKSAKDLESSLNIKGLYRDTLRPNRLRAWESYLGDQPALGCEVSSLAGFLGVSLVTVNDGRFRWGTPFDRPENIDMTFASQQNRLVVGLIRALARNRQLSKIPHIRNGFASVTGNARFLRHGELFADQRAPEAVFLAYQGQALYHAMSDQRGIFQIKGVADKKHVLDKLIIEGYRFDPQTGNAVWAIDKKLTGKPAYRLKIRKRSVETDLIMFACRQMTLFDLLEPRNLRYMSKIQLLDGRLEAPPHRYWYSRIDTRRSLITSLFLEPLTSIKLTLSDTILSKKLILLNADANHPGGLGYQIEKWPSLHNTTFLAARDMWSLLKPRIDNLERHGIYNNNIRALYSQGTQALDKASNALNTNRYDQFVGAASKSLALAGRVYNDVDDTQKDVLLGVLFYIALFVPFAFCLERLLFSFTGIHQRIITFLAILAVLIGIIYNVHPAFDLAYSPMVVILAFFIMGLSFLVSLIIFFRFEDEMSRLQRRAGHAAEKEISHWKAFTAAFFLGVGNLRRRKLRTALTCITLIILTFTIMSFTSVKTSRRNTRLIFSKNAAYQGLLLKNVNWQDLPPEAPQHIAGAFNGQTIIAPRAWLETRDRIRSPQTTLHYQTNHLNAHGVIGLTPREIQVSKMGGLLKTGRWFVKGEQRVVLLPDQLAGQLGIPSDLTEPVNISLWGESYRVVGIFSGEAFKKTVDLDGEPLTPVTFPDEEILKMTDVEMEALESGENVLSFQSRYQHVDADLTVIIPYQTLMAAGGNLKSLAVHFRKHNERPDPLPTRPNESTTQISVDPAIDLANRFGFMIFSGEPQGTFLYHTSDSIQYAGMPNIAIPLLIAVLIVLNTMISSVYERKHEIGIYTSVGLAPYHVSFLFIAEAMAFAVLSVVIGYLAAQISAGIFSQTTLWEGLTVNYSSLAGVAAMFIVILVVLISVIYPSKVAARIAIPDVNRAWDLPEPQAGVLETRLPFFIKPIEICSIGGYLYDYLKRHQDVSHGIFSTGRLRCEIYCPALVEKQISVKAVSKGPADASGCSDTHRCREEVCFTIQCNVWLAPFDLGIMQEVILSIRSAQASPGFLELNVRMHRRTGETTAWKRIAKVFINTIRKQLLIWRSLDEKRQAEFKREFTNLDENIG